MRVGLDRYTIGHRGLNAEDTLEFVGSLGFEGVQFLDPESIAPDLDPRRLAEFRRKADARRMYLEVGLPSPNPIRRSRELGRDVSPSEHARDLARHARGAAALECANVRVYVGDRHDRFRRDVAWKDQLAATSIVLIELAATLRELGIRIAIETHADLTIEELLRLIDRLGTEVAGVTLDTGNLLMRLIDPIPAVERLAPLVLCTHVKDAVLAFTDRGLCWQARPVGSGIVPIREIVGTLANQASVDLNLSIELHPRTYDLPIHDPSWLAYFPEIRPDAVAAAVRYAWLCEKRYDDGSMPRPSVVEAAPWEDRYLKWMELSREYLQKVVAS